MADKPKLIICTDGGAKGNPGPAACAAVIKAADDEQTVLERGKYLGHATNNVAEYEAVLLGLAMAKDLGAGTVEIRSDSELMVRQLIGAYKVKNEGLRVLFDRVKAALRDFDGVEIRHVRREKNEEADSLVNKTIAQHRHGGLKGSGGEKRPPAGGQNGTFRLK